MPRSVYRTDDLGSAYPSTWVSSSRHWSAHLRRLMFRWSCWYHCSDLKGHFYSPFFISSRTCRVGGWWLASLFHFVHSFVFIVCCSETSLIFMRHSNAGAEGVPYLHSDSFPRGSCVPIVWKWRRVSFDLNDFVVRKCRFQLWLPTKQKKTPSPDAQRFRYGQESAWVPIHTHSTH